jgi:hypothetical protein
LLKLLGVPLRPQAEAGTGSTSNPPQ